MQSVEASARTVEEAIAKALRQLGLDRSQVDVEILSHGRPRILGFGGEPARVIVRPLVATATAEPTASPAVTETDAPATARQEEAVRTAVTIVRDLLRLLAIEATVTSRPPVTPGDGVGLTAAVIDVEGEDLGLLIGRRGETLAAFQYLVNLLLARRTGTRVVVGIDVGGYRRRREEWLRNLALRMADRVRSTGQSITLEPMPPSERRIVHLALANHPDVLTVSIGEGESRKVAITPRR
jgi:spoIIIJ-associated protein